MLNFSKIIYIFGCKNNGSNVYKNVWCKNC